MCCFVATVLLFFFVDEQTSCLVPNCYYPILNTRKFMDGFDAPGTKSSGILPELWIQRLESIIRHICIYMLTADETLKEQTQMFFLILNQVNYYPWDNQLPRVFDQHKKFMIEFQTAKGWSTLSFNTSTTGLPLGLSHPQLNQL